MVQRGKARPRPSHVHLPGARGKEHVRRAPVERIPRRSPFLSTVDLRSTWKRGGVRGKENVGVAGDTPARRRAEYSVASYSKTGARGNISTRPHQVRRGKVPGWASVERIHTGIPRVGEPWKGGHRGKVAKGVRGKVFTGAGNLSTGAGWDGGHATFPR